MKKFIYILFFIFSLSSLGQEYSLMEKFVLPSEVEETSGLIFLNGKIITHNDSGDDPNLYEIDTISGTISRIINITNATHIDWEDISQDNTHIYIADIGNNNGDRDNLIIYKILKSDFISSTSVTAEQITFSYEDQTDFTSQPNNSNFDAEAIAVYQENIFIFSKNWVDFKTNAYVIPTATGNYSAEKVSSYDSQGLITGVSYNASTDGFLFCGYNNTLIPFLLYVGHNRPSSLDIFGGVPTRIDLIDSIFLEQGSQIEGITFFEDSKYYISREFFSTNIGTATFEFPQKLYEFYNPLDNLLSITDDEFSDLISVVPNPIEDSFKIIQKNKHQEIQSFSLFSLNGRKKISKKKQDEINLKNISKGVYLLKIEFKNGGKVVKKVIKK
tara:strand:- start:1493 stop:2650 length:1158 start_codon:yes stop_codon:yes gene_type:complete